MASTRSRVSAFALAVSCVALVDCGASDRVSPTAPAAAPAAPQSAAPVHPGRVAMPVGDSVLKPADFKASIHLDPKPDEDGVVRAGSPVLEHFDLCGSTAGAAGGELYYLYDFNFDGLADVIDKGGDCTREHKYAAPHGAGNKVELRSNICVVTGNPEAPGPNTYFSCRTVRVEVKPTPETGSNSGCHDVCQIGGPLAPSCGDCAAKMCVYDSFCCTVEWDVVCAEDVGSVCGVAECENLPNTLDLSAITVQRRSLRRP